MQNETALRSEPPAFDEPGWEESVRGGGAQARRMVIAWADGERASGTALGARRAARAYRACAADLRPSDPADASRLVHVFADLNGHTEEVAALAFETLRCHGLSDLRDEAAVVAARQMHREGRLSECEALLRDVVVRHRGTGTWTEARAWERLAIVNGMEARTFEALACVSHALALFDSLGAGSRALPLHVMRVRVLLDLGDVTRASEALAAAERVAGDDGVGEFEQRLLGLLRVTFLSTADRPVEALEVLDGLPDAWFGAADAPERRMFLFQRASLLVAAGRHDEAAHEAERADAKPGPADRFHFGLLETLMRARAESGRRGEALGIARDLLAEIRAAGRGSQGYTWRSTAARAIAKTLEECGAPADEVRGAWDLSARQMLARAAEVERAAAEVPEYLEIPAADIAVLREWRARMATSYADILAEVRRCLEADARASGAGALRSLVSEGAMAACAWCSRVRTRDGKWVPVGHYLPDDVDSFAVSHGICGTCHDGVIVGFDDF